MTLIRKVAHTHMTRKKRPLILALGTLALIGLTLAGLCIAPEDEMLLASGEGVENQRPPVPFSHDLHMGLYECLACHHDFEDGVNVLDEDDLVEGDPAVLCASCHNGETDLDRREAYHRQCIGCHIDERKAGQSSAPELCGSCHLPER